jgi:hypothetical protein
VRTQRHAPTTRKSKLVIHVMLDVDNAAKRGIFLGDAPEGVG